MFNTKIKYFQSDWGGEYRSLSRFLDASGVVHRLSCPHTHQQNGLAERKHRHIIESTLALLHHAGLPFKYWEDAASCAVFLINRLPSPVLHHLSPFQKLFGRPPNYHLLRTFGCACYPLLRPYQSNKFSYRSTQCIFLGYSTSHKGYRCLEPSSNRVYVTPHVIFDEACFPYRSSPLASTTSQPGTLIHFPSLLRQPLGSQVATSPALGAATPAKVASPTTTPSTTHVVSPSPTSPIKIITSTNQMPTQ